MPISNEQRTYLAKFVNARFGPAYRYWEDNYYQRQRDWDDYWHVRLPSTLEAMIDSDERSSLVPPDIHFLVNDFRASLVLPFVRAGRQARIRGIGPSDIENEPFAQALYDWHLRITKYWHELDKDAQNIALCGYAFGLTELKPLVSRTIQKGKVVEKELYRGGKFPHYRHLDRYRVFPAPNAQALKYPDCAYICYVDYMSREELLSLRAENKAVWDFTVEDLDKVYRDSSGSNSPQLVQDQDWGRRLEVVKETAKIPVVHYVGQYVEREGGELMQALISVAGEKEDASVVLRFEKPNLPMPPVDFFHLMTLNPDDARLLSMGKVEAIEDTYIESFVKRNQRIEQVNVNTNGINFIRSNGEIPAAHRLGPLTFIEVDDPVNVQTFSGGNSGELYREVSELKNEIRENFGSDYSLGVNPQNEESATGANILMESHTKSIVMAAHHLWNSGMGRMAETHHALLQEYCPNEVIVRLSEDEKRPFLRVTPEHIKGQFDFSLGLGIDDFTPDAVRQARFERVAAFYRDDPDIDAVKLKKRHLQVMGLGDANLLVISPEEREIWPRKETAMILRTGQQIPIDDAEDHMIHYRIHLQGVQLGIQLAQQNRVRADFVEVLLEHANMHLNRMAAEQGIQAPERNVIPRGNGRIGQPSPKRPVDRIQNTRAGAQRIAGERAVFE